MVSLTQNSAFYDKIDNNIDFQEKRQFFFRRKLEKKFRTRGIITLAPDLQSLG
jgi:hypothetical protein